MIAVAIAAAAEGAEQTRELPFPPAVFGIGAIVVFGLLLGVTWMFRGNSTKH